MPFTHSRVFRVRYYECDAYGHLNNANYLRYMQETAFDASAAAGFGIQRYAEMQRLWLIRGTQIEYLRPVRYNDSIEVKTWVMEFRRVSSRRAYEFYLEGTQELVARAYTDWVFIDTNTGRATTILPEVSAAYFPKGVHQSSPQRENYPIAPPPPSGVFKMRRRVSWRDIDQMHHVNNAVYLEYIEECGMQVIAAHHWPWTRMAAEGFAIILRQHHIQYLQPALIEDELEIATWVSEVKRSSAMRHYTIRRAGDGELLAQVHTLGVWIDLSTGRPIRIPPNFIADFASNISAGERLEV